MADINIGDPVRIVNGGFVSQTGTVTDVRDLMTGLYYFVRLDNTDDIVAFRWSKIARIV